MSAREYILRFNSLAGYAPAMVADMGDRVHRFVSGLGPHLIKECLMASLQEGMDITRIQAHAQNLEEQQQPQKGERDSDRRYSKRARSFGTASHIMRDCPLRVGGGVAQPTGSAVGSSSSVCPPRQTSQTPAGRDRGRGGASRLSSPQNRIYALTGRQNLESSPDIVTGTLSVFSHDVCALLDPDSTLLYVTLYIVGWIGAKLESIKPFKVFH
ncbi:uncharacterized protein LOC132630603 [Lycium barbarum]|uniref:uncharacterized protein LOC132630603 n=1 Tax=Lycium barbarum TaxID=112863 RepID=UPI00293F75CF|nr:uncharacterized protein LOC132630603 [Lycium barbarum]